MNRISKQLIMIAKKYLATDYKKQKKLQQIFDTMEYKDYNDEQLLSYLKLVCKYHRDFVQQVMRTLLKEFKNKSFVQKAYNEYFKTFKLDQITDDDLNELDITEQQLKSIDPNQERFFWGAGQVHLVDVPDSDDTFDYDIIVQGKYECQDCGVIFDSKDLEYENECPFCNGQIEQIN